MNEKNSTWNKLEITIVMIRINSTWNIKVNIQNKKIMVTGKKYLFT